ncbi:MAG: PIG-L deacetylase family protein [Candidatus Woesearchaeota archaeon]|jgi:LmbE family N-acetylglucosaminyl deacetylase
MAKRKELVEKSMNSKIVSLKSNSQSGSKGTILVVCAHSDDQVIGPGGAMAKYAREGYDVFTIIFSYGEGSHPHMKLSYVAKTRVLESKEADAIIGGKGVMFLALKDGHMKEDFTNKKMMDRFKRLLASYKPCKIFTHSIDDLFPDHRFVREIVLEACDSLSRKNIIDPEIYSFDIWNLWSLRKRTEPKLVVDISDTFKYKIRALHTFKSQINFFSHTILVNVLYLLVYVKAFINGKKYGFKTAEVFYKIR